MKSRICRRLFLVVVTAAGLALGGGHLLHAAEPPAKKLRALIIDGQNNHKWQATTPAIRLILEESGRFDVDVATMPAGRDEVEARAKFLPEFEKYDVVVSNYNDFRGPAAPKAFLDKLATWVKNGGAFVSVHAAAAGMNFHDEYWRMIGLGWGKPEKGVRLAVDDAGKIVRTAAGEGRGTGHGRQAPIDVTIRAADHPIVEGLPRNWTVRQDELWLAARGPAEELTVLATGYSAETEKNEPIQWTVGYGQGRIFVTLLGHDATNMQDPGFEATLARGCEWAATEKVTLPVPKGILIKKQGK